MTNALVTGPAERVAEVATVLWAGGYRTYSIADGAPLAAACVPIPPASVACYVQLPGEVGPDAPDSREVHALLAQNLVRRFDILGVVAPLLAPGASVLLVAGDRREPGPALEPEPPVLAMLARAVLGDHGAEDVLVRVVGTDLSTGPQIQRSPNAPPGTGPLLPARSGSDGDVPARTVQHRTAASPARLAVAGRLRGPVRTDQSTG